MRRIPKTTIPDSMTGDNCHYNVDADSREKNLPLPERLLENLKKLELKWNFIKFFLIGDRCLTKGCTTV